MKIRTHTTSRTHNEDSLHQATSNASEALAQPIAEHPILTSAEYQQVIYDWNNTACDYPDDKTLHQLFQEQAHKTPDHVALICDTQTLTYRELDEASNQLAWFIRKHYDNQSTALTPDTLIALFLDRSIDMVIGILGILKAGAAYVPVDPNYPVERINYIFQDTQSSIVLTQRHFIQNLVSFKAITTIALDDAPFQNESRETPPSINQPMDLAYVIYTSGTTGTPKGVAIPHTGAVNRIDWMQRAYPLSQDDVVLQKTPYGFDVSVWELLWAHQYGATLVMAKPNGHQDALYLNELICEKNITVMHFVPSMLSAFTQALHDNNMSIPSTLRYIFCSGEALALNQVQAFYALSHHEPQIHNLYGPTEASIDVTYYPCPRDVSKIYIGKPIHNTQVYVLDEDLCPVPPGMVGELYLGGVGLARGYINKPELTAERFIPNPFATTAQRNKGADRLYKTGDLARWTHDGYVEYLGRNDFQVKIRGYRIELNEIEHALSLHSDIRQSIVLAQQNNEHAYLVAYYVSEKTISNTSLMAHLQRYLPDYMLPSAFMPMKAFPLTVNGKLDRGALPRHTFQIDEQTYLAPRTVLEETLANIWSEALNLDSVGVEDHFFHLGGHSLSAARIVATIKQKLGKHLLLADFYRAGTIANLIHCLDEIKEPDQQHTQHALEQHSRGKLPLDDFQLMLWLSHLFEPKAKKMNIIVRKRLQGTLNIQALQQAFQDTFVKQDALHYRIARLFPTQFKQNKLPFEITQQHVEHLSEKACESFLLDSVNALTNVYPWPRHYPLVLARLFHLPNDVVELQLCMPHLIADEMSLQILCNDLSRHYLNHTQQRQDTVSLYPFKDYIAYEQRVNNTSLEQKITFWENHLHDAQLFVFPKHHVVNNMDKQKLSYSTYTEIPEASLTYLRHFCAENHVNVNDTLSAALATALKECCPGHDYESHPMLINLIKSTRENPDYDHTIGCFVRVDPLKVDLSHQPSMASLSKQIHRTVIDTAPQQQCSTLLKFACLTKCFHKKALLKSWFTRLGMFFYTKILRQLKLSFDQDRVFNLCWRLAAFNRKHYFIVNLNLWNNFLASQDQTQQLFDLQSAPIPMHPYELLTIDYTLDVCFLRDESSQKPYVVISSNLTPEFRERLAAKIIALISDSAV